MLTGFTNVTWVKANNQFIATGLFYQKVIKLGKIEEFTEMTTVTHGIQEALSNHILKAVTPSQT
jgi:hypothetical protein